RATGRGPRRRRPRAKRGFGWRWVGYGLGMGVLGVSFLALSSLLNGDLRPARQRVAAPSSPAPRGSVEDDSRVADPSRLPSVASAPEVSPSALPAPPSAPDPGLMAARDSTESLSPPPEAKPNDQTGCLSLPPDVRPSPTPVATVTRFVPSLPPRELSPPERARGLPPREVSLPERPTRGERRPPTRMGSIGETVVPSTGPSLSPRLPSLE